MGNQFPGPPTHQPNQGLSPSAPPPHGPSSPPSNQHLPPSFNQTQPQPARIGELAKQPQQQIQRPGMPPQHQGTEQAQPPRSGMPSSHHQQQQPSQRPGMPSQSQQMSRPGVPPLSSEVKPGIPSSQQQYASSQGPTQQHPGFPPSQGLHPSHQHQQVAFFKLFSCFFETGCISQKKFSFSLGLLNKPVPCS